MVGGVQPLGAAHGDTRLTSAACVHGGRAAGVEIGIHVLRFSPSNRPRDASGVISIA